MGKVLKSVNKRYRKRQEKKLGSVIEANLNHIFKEICFLSEIYKLVPPSIITVVPVI